MTAGRQRGFALLIVLWTLVLVTLLVTQLNSAGRGETQLAANLRNAGRLQADADGAVHAAIYHLMDRSPQGWRAGGAARVVPLGDAVAEVRITDEAGRINPSTATPELLQALMRVVGVDAATASAIATGIVVWRTPFGQSEASQRRFDVYRAAGRAYGPSGAAFLSMDELGAVLGMTPDLLARLAPHLSLYVEGDPDPAVADPIVRQAMTVVAGGRLSDQGRQADAVRVLAIEADVADAGGGHFIRRAVVRLTQIDGAPDYRILSWEALSG